MRIFGLRVPFTERSLTPAPKRGGMFGWLGFSLESFPGAFQRNVEIKRDTVLTNHAVFACQTLIASDIAKLRAKLVAKAGDGIWAETTSPAYSPVLRKPNRYQNRIQFFESWALSRLQHGNAVVLIERDNRRVVVRLHVLDWRLVTPLVADDGSVFYDLKCDKLVGLPESIVVPASEIIHDRFNCLFHPLIGISPIFANGLAAMQGLAIQTNSTKFFQNNSQPGGILTAPGKISQDTADRLKDTWETKFSGENAGKVAVLGDGLKYEPMAVTANDAQLIDQLKWTAEVICSTYHVPPYKIGVGQMPTYNNIQSLNVEYYSQCLQAHIEAIELSLDEGLGIGEGVSIDGKTYGVEFDVPNLLRMDSVTQMDVLDKGKNVMKPNEARKMLDLPPVAGGDTVYRQQQDYSLEALHKRDAKDDPFAKAGPPAPATSANDDDVPLNPEAARMLTDGLTRAHFQEVTACLG